MMTAASNTTKTAGCFGPEQTTAPCSAPEKTKPEKDDRATEIAGDVMELARAWARYGLLVGRSALEASAGTLVATARLLGHLAEAFDSKPRL